MLAALIRLQLGWPEHQWLLLSRLLPKGMPGGVMTPEFYLAVVTMHGTIMVFFFISYVLVSGFGNYLVPLQVGARDMAFPFLNMLSYWIALLSAVVMLASFFVEGGAAAAGWTAYPPLSAVAAAVPGSQMGQTIWLLSMALFIASFTMSGLNIVATVFSVRAPGLSMMRLPLTVWSYFIASILGLLAFPPLTAAAVMLLLDRHFGTSFFLPSGLVVGDKLLPNTGGSPLLWQHLFWFLGHPEVYVLILPALGDRVRHPAGVHAQARVRLPHVGLVPRGGRLPQHDRLGPPHVRQRHEPVHRRVLLARHADDHGADDDLRREHAGEPVGRQDGAAEPPMLFALGVIALFGSGGLGGLFLGNATADMQLHDTYFVVGHFHMMIGGVTLLATFAAIYFWFPKMFGRMMNETLGKLHFWFTFVPFFIIFFMQHFLGLQGAPRRYYAFTAYDYLQKTRGQNLVISIAAMVLISGQLPVSGELRLESVQGTRGRGESLARDDARMDRGVAAAAREFRRRAAWSSAGPTSTASRTASATSRRRRSRRGPCR